MEYLLCLGIPSFFIVGSYCICDEKSVKDCSAKCDKRDSKQGSKKYLIYSRPFVNLKNDNCICLIIYPVKHAIISNTNPKNAVLTDNCFRARRHRIRRQGILNFIHHSLDKRCLHLLKKFHRLPIIKEFKLHIPNSFRSSVLESSFPSFSFLWLS